MAETSSRLCDEHPTQVIVVTPSEIGVDRHLLQRFPRNDDVPFAVNAPALTPATLMSVISYAALRAVFLSRVYIRRMWTFKLGIAV